MQNEFYLAGAVNGVRASDNQKMLNALPDVVWFNGRPNPYVKDPIRVKVLRDTGARLPAVSTDTRGADRFGHLLRSVGRPTTHPDSLVRRYIKTAIGFLFIGRTNIWSRALGAQIALAKRALETARQTCSSRARGRSSGSDR